MDTNIELRRATLEDAAAMAVLSEQLGYPVSDADMRTRLETMLADVKHHCVLVTAKHDSLTGWIHVTRVDRLELPAHGEIAALVVAERQRGQGIGAQLVTAAIRWTRDLGLTRLTVRSRVERDDAHRFYKRMGFSLEKTQRVMTRVL